MDRIINLIQNSTIYLRSVSEQVEVLLQHNTF